MNLSLTVLTKNSIFTKRSFVLNELVKYLHMHNMLPAMCFVFSRKHVEICASEIHLSLFPDDSIIPADVMKMLKPKRVVNLAKLTDLVDAEHNVILADRTGFIVDDQAGRAFQLDAFGRKVEGISFRLLPCEVFQLLTIA